VNAIKSLGWLHVVGIAGPAEPLASSEAFETLRLIHAAHPELVLCLSTNGLNLERGLPGLIALGLRALTVTINAADADVASRLYAWAELDGERVPGGEAANEILRRQWRGLEQAARTGLLVKVNSVFVPGLNDRNLAAVARRAAALGAHRQNIMSLIPRGRMRDRRPPSRRELAAVQRECEQHIPQFRGCTQCPADVIEPPLSLGAGDRQCVCTRPTEKICTLTAT
jgi:nitrogen fixation protein NifB